MVGPIQLIIIILVVLIIFGAGKLPKLMNNRAKKAESLNSDNINNNGDESPGDEKK